MAEAPPVIRRSAEVERKPARRAGWSERKLLGPAESPHQNVLLCEGEPGATVEVHRVANSESFFVIEGGLEVDGPGYREVLGPGDLVHFHPGMAHGARVLGDAPARFLIVFAPARAGA